MPCRNEEIEMNLRLLILNSVSMLEGIPREGEGLCLLIKLPFL